MPAPRKKALEAATPLSIIRLEEMVPNKHATATAVLQIIHMGTADEPVGEKRLMAAIIICDPKTNSCLSDGTC